MLQRVGVHGQMNSRSADAQRCWRAPPWWEAARGYSRSLLAPRAGLPTSLALRNCLGLLELEVLLLLVMLSLRAGVGAGGG